MNTQNCSQIDTSNNISCANDIEKKHIATTDNEKIAEKAIIKENSILGEDLIENFSDENQNQERQGLIKLSESEQGSNSILFYGITYLGCASVNAPKDEIEINRIMSTLNEQGKEAIEVTLSIPQIIENKIILNDKSETKIAEYKMSQVLFVVRGGKNSNENGCFAFTTCYGTSSDNLIFSCHVFRCNLPEAVGKILYSFWQVFNRQSIQNPQQPNNTESLSRKSSENPSSVVSTAGQIASFLGSFYGFGQNSASNNTNSSISNVNSDLFNEFAAKFVNCRKEDQYVFRTILEIKEEDPKNLSVFTSVPKEKDFFKLRKNLQKQINIQIVQLTNHPLEIERCFGVLICQGRNASHKDMQLLHTISMGKSGIENNNPSNIFSRPSNSSSSLSSSTFSTNIYNNSNNSYIVSAIWNPADTASSLRVLNEETPKNSRVFMTVAIDLVINGLQDPVRFCIETKARIYSQNEKFWVYQRNKHIEEFYLQIIQNQTNISDKNNTSKPNIINYNLKNIYSHTELVRKQNAITRYTKIDDQPSNSIEEANDAHDQDNEEIVMSGVGDVSKDCNEEELLNWSDILSEWRKKTWVGRPRGLQSLVRRGIPEALRGEVWQLLAGCNENEKNMNESYRLLLSKESSCEDVILRDVNRTFPGHQFFQEENGQQALYKLSKAYSIYDEEVGYCQGLSFLIASLLLHMPEEQAFNLLVKIMYRYEIREIYKTNFVCLHMRFHQLETLIREFLPELYEHFVDLNIEPHMYASQWFLTLFTAKFPLYMVFRILDLFLYEGFSAIFSVALALLKSSQRDLLALDFEGILKYFRVNMPKKYRSEQNFNQLMNIWAIFHSKLTEKKLKKIEINYKKMKEEEAFKEDPSARYEKECKRLTMLIRRLEQENDDLANEYIDNKMTLSKQLDDLKEEFDSLKNETNKNQIDYQDRINESNDTNSKLTNELDQLKQLWRKQSEKYESEIERSNIIINEYKKICNTLSNKVEKWSNLKKTLQSRTNTLSLCERCSQINHIELGFDEELVDDLNINKKTAGSVLTTLDNQVTENMKFDESKNKDFNTEIDSQKEETDLSRKIKFLELELARVKLELVDSQCKNQEYDHKIRTLINTSKDQFKESSNEFIKDSPDSIISSSSSSLSTISYKNKTKQLVAQTDSNSYSQNFLMMNNLDNRNNSNNWLSKTFSQFKEATNQVVQKAQKAKNSAN
jgi:hypothetical protein